MPLAGLKKGQGARCVFFGCVYTVVGPPHPSKPRAVCTPRPLWMRMLRRKKRTSAFLLSEAGLDGPLGGQRLLTCMRLTSCPSRVSWACLWPASKRDRAPVALFLAAYIRCLGHLTPLNLERYAPQGHFGCVCCGEKKRCDAFCSPQVPLRNVRARPVFRSNTRFGHLRCWHRACPEPVSALSVLRRLLRGRETYAQFANLRPTGLWFFGTPNKVPCRDIRLRTLPICKP